MYSDLGFLRVWGADAGAGGPASRYAYLIYPHKPIMAYVPRSSGCSTSTASSSPTASGHTAARGCPPPTTCSRSGSR